MSSRRRSVAPRYRRGRHDGASPELGARRRGRMPAGSVRRMGPLLRARRGQIRFTFAPGRRSTSPPVCGSEGRFLLCVSIDDRSRALTSAREQLRRLRRPLHGTNGQRVPTAPLVPDSPLASPVPAPQPRAGAGDARDGHRGHRRAMRGSRRWPSPKRGRRRRRSRELQNGRAHGSESGPFSDSVMKVLFGLGL